MSPPYTPKRIKRRVDKVCYTANFDGGTTTINERQCIYWGFQIRDTIHQSNGFTSSYTTNNEAEYIALIKLLEHLVTISEIRSDRTRTTDSEILDQKYFQ